MFSEVQGVPPTGLKFLVKSVRPHLRTTPCAQHRHPPPALHLRVWTPSLRCHHKHDLLQFQSDRLRRSTLGEQKYVSETTCLLHVIRGKGITHQIHRAIRLCNILSWHCTPLARGSKTFFDPRMWLREVATVFRTQGANRSQEPLHHPKLVMHWQSHVVPGEWPLHPLLAGRRAEDGFGEHDIKHRIL